MASDPTNPPESASPGATFMSTAATAAITGAGFMIVPRHVLGQGMTPPSDLVNIATVGINGMGAREHDSGHEPEHRRDLRRRLRPASTPG